MTKPLAFVLPGPLDALTGGTRYDRRIVEGLRDSGTPVDVIELEGSFPFPSDEARADAADRFAALRAGTPTVVDGLALGALAEEIAAHAARLELVALVHHPLCDEAGLAPFDALRLRDAERRALRTTHGAVVTSPATAVRVAELFGDAVVVRVVEPGLARVEGGARSRQPDGPFELTAVGALTPRKAQLVLLDALRELDEFDWRLTIVGRLDQDPAYAQQVQDAARDFDERVVLAGALSDAERDERLEATDVFVHPALYEGFGMAVHEALARGLPVVTTTGGALVETVPEDAGIRVVPGDAAALRAGLERVLGDAELRASLAEGALRATADARSWEAAAHEFATALEQLAPRSGGGFDAGWLALRAARTRLGGGGRSSPVRWAWGFSPSRAPSCRAACSLRSTARSPEWPSSGGRGSGSGPQTCFPTTPGRSECRRPWASSVAFGASGTALWRACSSWRSPSSA